ncbi:iron-sulfur cluster repair di-iron protein [bacterium]|nr:iron-sulfur cluster repair di-iron protein [bacterium]
MDFLDVTKIEPKFKHPTIFEKFDSLPKGESFILHNDHDPVPLYYQLLHERGKIFDWEYLKRGPEVFEIKITKLLPEENLRTIGEIVAEDIRKAEVFRKFGLDFCCGGHKTVKQACDEAGVSYKAVENALNLADRSSDNRSQNFNAWKPDFLADYIQNTHHVYVLEAFDLLDQISVKVAHVHGQNHPELIRIAEIYKSVEQELLHHLPDEENILFPRVKELVNSAKQTKPSESGSVLALIGKMQQEHSLVGDKMKEIRKLSKDFQPPHDACTSYKLLFAKLEEFETDLFEHIHLENNILFPKVVTLEKELLG